MTAPAPTAPCGPQLAGADGLLRKGAVVLLGEFHGTHESPRLVAQLMCLAAAKGLRVRVGLEVPRDEQPRLNAFLGSSRLDAKASLLEGRFWTARFQDGRSSEAMVGLLNDVRTLLLAGKDIAVLAYDSGSSGDARDAEMAANIVALLGNTREQVSLVLSGNVHARKTKGTPWNAGYVPMAWHLLQTYPTLVSLNLEDGGGDAWVCSGKTGCDVHPLQGVDRGSARFVELNRSKEPGYDGVVYLGRVTASLPAIGIAMDLELKRLADEDQADRKSGAPWAEVSARDAERRGQVRALIAIERTRPSADYFHAALVLQHGQDAADFQRAHELASKAAALDPTHTGARWLAAASKDRELMTRGEPQRYGTQSRKGDAGWVLYPVDPAVTDDERAQWGVPPLNEARRRIAAMNAPK